MMRHFLLPVLIVIIQDCLGQEKFQLAPPMLKYQSGFFNSKTSFEVIFNQPGAEVRYTLDGKEPGEKDFLYTKPVAITRRTLLKARAFSKDFLPSETVTASFINDGKPVRAARFSKPNESYAKSKPDILVDNIGGIANYRSGTWVGFDSDTVTVDIDLNKKEAVQTVLISLLQDENSWIFLPEQILVYYFDSSKNAFLPFGKETFVHERPGLKACSVREIEPRVNVSTDRLKLILFPLKKIPDWHTGKGQHGWLFIDEIKVY